MQNKYKNCHPRVKKKEKTPMMQTSHQAPKVLTEHGVIQDLDKTLGFFQNILAIYL